MNLLKNYNFNKENSNFLMQKNKKDVLRLKLLMMYGMLLGHLKLLKRYSVILLGLKIMLCMKGVINFIGFCVIMLVLWGILLSLSSQDALRSS